MQFPLWGFLARSLLPTSIGLLRHFSPDERRRSFGGDRDLAEEGLVYSCHRPYLLRPRFPNMNKLFRDFTRHDWSDFYWSSETTGSSHIALERRFRAQPLLRTYARFLTYFSLSLQSQSSSRITELTWGRLIYSCPRVSNRPDFPTSLVHKSSSRCWTQRLINSSLLAYGSILVRFAIIWRPHEDNAS